MVDSIREALTAAIDKAEKEAPPVTVAAADDEVADPGTEASKVSEAAAPLESEVSESVPVTTGSTPVKETSAPVVAAPNAPASWTNEERAAWGAVSPAAQKAILRREGEMQRAFQTSSASRKRVEQFDALAEPYKPLLNRYGVTLEQALPPLLATRAALEVGTPDQKAELVANICADYGIPLELLDTALAARFQNGVPQQHQIPVQPDLSNNPALAPLFAIAAQIKERQQASAIEAVAEVQTLPHYEEVRFTMADLLEKAKEHGKSLDLKTAHRLASELHGFGTQTAQQAATTVSEAAAILARSRNAASSVSGAPVATAPRKPGEGTIRDEIESLYDSSSKRR